MGVPFRCYSDSNVNDFYNFYIIAKGHFHTYYDYSIIRTQLPLIL